MRKLILIILLVIPFAIYLFLKVFGENKYVLPLYYQDGVTLKQCELEISGQYKIPNPQEFELKPSGVLRDSTITLYFVYSRGNSSSEYIVTELQRLLENKLASSRMQLAVLSKNDQVPDIGKIISFQGIQSEVERFLECGLAIGQQMDMADEFTTMVLVDSRRRIRGYYKGTDIEEFDRLSAEVQILLTED